MQRKQTEAAWHFLALRALTQRLDATEHGLSEGEAAARLTEYGPNKLPQDPPAAL